MSRGSKSVSFEKYRENCWQDNNSGGSNNRNEDSYNCHSGPKRDSRREYEAISNFYELPPPLEPRERLVRCVDPVTAELSVIPNWWQHKLMGGNVGNGSSMSPNFLKRNDNHDRINSGSYIMPSSLVPVSQNRHFLWNGFIPPPTPYRNRDPTDARENNMKNSSYPYFSSNDYNECESSCDIVEIKRPTTVCLRRNESHCGLAPHYKLPNQDEPHNSCTSIESDYNFSDENLRRIHQEQSSLRSGLFNLPEVYSPPPLAPHLGTQRQQRFNIHQKSPRLAYSDPILKPENEMAPGKGVKSENLCLSPRFRNKTFIIGSSKRNNREENNNSPSSSGDQNFLLHDSSKEQNRESLNPSDNCRRPHHDGSGDHNENALAIGAKPSKTTNHNCLSPRARLSRLQPSVITPAITESLLCDCLANLKSAHWEDNFEAFSQIYNLTELHPGRVKSILNKVIWHGLPHLSSPRTKLARMACICFKRLFQTQKRSMETEGEKIFYRLLDLCGGLANNFIQQESREALVAAVENMDPLKSLTFLELHGAKHKNPHVREFSAYLLNAIMDELPQNRLMNKDFSPRIIPMVVSFLREGLLQTRLHAKLALDKIFDHSTFESKLRRYVSPENVRHISDTLREFRERRSGHV